MTSCPNCKLVNPADSRRCDCGYDFDTRNLGEPFGGERKGSLLASARWWLLLAAFTLMLVIAAAGWPHVTYLAYLALILLSWQGFRDKRER